MSITQDHDFFFQGNIHMRWDHAGDIPAERGDFLDRARGQEGMFLGSDERDRFDIAGKSLICEPHAELELKIREHAQAAHDHLCIDLPRELHRESAIARDFDLRIIVERLAYQIHALVGGKHQGFQRR